VTSKWLSKPAVLWVLDEAPSVPPHLVAALAAIARYADTDGRGAHPSVTTIAAQIRKGERATKRDLAALKRLGLLLPGDPRIVAHIAADKRPTVYNLPMPRGGAQDTPQTFNGVTQTTPRGVAYKPARGGVEMPNGVSHTSPKEFLKNSGISGSGAAAPPQPPPELCLSCGRQLRTGHIPGCPEDGAA
jgi:hypothetical protein